jgi:site-specific DNA-methyltransferase (adenine-specific)
LNLHPYTRRALNSRDTLATPRSADPIDTRRRRGARTTAAADAEQDVDRRLADLFRGLKPAFASPERGVWIFGGDCRVVLERLNSSETTGLFDMAFADPPYFLSNDGITCQSGKMVNVNKGEWDRSRGAEENHAFNREWLAHCQSALKPNGTVWVSGTHHVILSVGFAMQQLGMKILNNITWEKPNPPPNLSCRYFTHSTETLLWAAKSSKSKHVFNYQAMRERAGGRQMKSVWRLKAPPKSEKTHGKHPTQKPEALLELCVESSSQPGALVLDPFLGSGTTAAVALRLGRRVVGIEADPKWLDLAVGRMRRALQV